MSERKNEEETDRKKERNEESEKGRDKIDVNVCVVCVMHCTLTIPVHSDACAAVSVADIVSRR